MIAIRFVSGSAVRAAFAASLLLALGCQGDNLPSAPPPPAPVASITLAFPGPTLSMGAVLGLLPQFRDADGNVLTGLTAAWASSNAGIASVDQVGNVTGVALGGPVTITVSKDGHSASASVSVIPDRINFSPYVSTLGVNQTLQLSAIPLDYSGTAIPNAPGLVTWSSGTPSVATVDAATGLVTTNAPGLVRIFATAAGRTGGLEIEVGIPSSYDGTWAGSSVTAGGGGMPVQFTVVFAKIKQFQMTYPASGCFPGSSVVASPNAPIVGDQFSFTFSSGVAGTQGQTTVSGRFTSPSTLNGTTGSISLGSCVNSGVGGIAIGSVPGGVVSASKQ